MNGHTWCSGRVFRHSSANELMVLQKGWGQPGPLWAGELLHAPILAYCKPFLSLLQVFHTFIQMFLLAFALCSYINLRSVYLRSSQSVLCLCSSAHHYQVGKTAFGKGFQRCKKEDEVPVKEEASWGGLGKICPVVSFSLFPFLSFLPFLPLSFSSSLMDFLAVSLNKKLIMAKACSQSLGQNSG